MLLPLKFIWLTMNTTTLIDQNLRTTNRSVERIDGNATVRLVCIVGQSRFSNGTPMPDYGGVLGGTASLNQAMKAESQ